MSTYPQPKSADGDGHQLHLFDRLPCYTTRLVCEKQYPYPPRVQVCSPADVAAIMLDYYQGKDREEFVVVLLNTANIIVGFSVVSVGGLAASIVEPRQVFKLADPGKCRWCDCCSQPPIWGGRTIETGHCDYAPVGQGWKADGHSHSRSSW